jgi:hypothetical protein
MFKFELLLSYQREPWTGLGGGETLTYTGEEVGVDTATAVHWTPFHFQVLPFEVYTCPTVGLGGKEYAIFVRALYNCFYPPAYLRHVVYSRPGESHTTYPITYNLSKIPNVSSRVLYV